MENFKDIGWWRRDTDCRPRHRFFCVTCGFSTNLTYAWGRHIESAAHKERRKTKEHRILWELGYSDDIKAKDKDPLILTDEEIDAFIRKLLEKQYFDYSFPSELIKSIMCKRKALLLVGHKDYPILNDSCSILYDILSKGSKHSTDKYSRIGIPKDLKCKDCNKTVSSRRNWYKHLKTKKHLKNIGVTVEDDKNPPNSTSLDKHEEVLIKEMHDTQTDLVMTIKEMHDMLTNLISILSSPPKSKM